jgi:hypothetical protein
MRILMVIKSLKRSTSPEVPEKKRTVEKKHITGSPREEATGEAMLSRVCPHGFCFSHGHEPSPRDLVEKQIIESRGTARMRLLMVIEELKSSTSPDVPEKE